jgi:hypothetical protein
MKKTKVCKDPMKEPYPLPNGRCIFKCKEGSIRNTSTGKCDKISTSIPIVPVVPTNVCKEVPRTKINIEKFIKDIEKYKTAKNLIEGYKVDDKDINNVVGELNKLNKEPEENNKSQQGFIYERLWDICIKLGLTTELTDSTIYTTKHVIGNSCIIGSTSNVNIGDYFNKYIEEGLISGNSGGYSDITFENQNKKTSHKILYLVSVKYIDITDNISIKKFDIQNLCTIIKEREEEYRDKNKDDKDMKNYEIKTLLFVKNKKLFIDEVCEKVNKSSNILIKYISPNGNYENVYDLDDLEIYYDKLRHLLKSYDYWKDDKITDFKKTYLNVDDIFKQPFIARFHQELFIEKINALMKKGEKELLIGAIPRSGKTYIMAGIILRHVQEHMNVGLNEFYNYVIITPAPNETLSQYIEAFEYNDFDRYNIKAFNIKEKGKYEKVKCHKVFLSSKQLLDNGLKTKDKIKKNIENYFKDDNLEKIDHQIIFLDEAHHGMGTENADEILEELLRKIDSTVNKNCCKIYVSATYNKISATYNKTKKKYKGIKDSNIIKWDLNDIKFIKKFYNNEEDIKSSGSSSSSGSKSDTTIKSFLEYFDNRFGKEIVNAVIKDRNKIELQYIKNISRQYQHFPDPFLITSIWDRDFLDKQRYLIEGTNFGFDMDKLFTYRKDGVTFENEEQLIELFEYYLGYPLEKKIAGIKCLKFDEYNKKNIDNSAEYPIIKSKLEDNIDHNFTDKELRDMDINKYTDIIIKIGSIYYKSKWEWKEIDRNYKEIGFLKTRGILPRIRDVCTNGCRTLQHTSNKTSQLWFLPGGVVGRLEDYIIFSLLQLLETKFKKFYDKHIFFICRTEQEIKNATNENEKEKKKILYNKFNNKNNIKFQTNGSNIKDQINVINNKIIDGNNEYYKKEGLIILSGGRLILGVSLPKVDIVTLFTNSKSFDEIYQMMFRSMTEVYTKDNCTKNSYCAKKKYGFMVDLNPQRVLSTLNYLQQNNNKNKIGPSENDYTTIADTMNIDRDIFINKFDDPFASPAEKKKAIKKFSEEFFQGLFKNSNYKDDIELNKFLDEIEYDDDEFEKIAKEYIRIFSNFKGVVQQPKSTSKDNVANAITDGPKVLKNKKKEGDKSDDKSGNKSDKSDDKSDKSDKKKSSSISNPEEIKKKIKSLKKIIISLLSVIAPCFNDDECVILNNNEDDDNSQPIKYNKIIDLLNNIEKEDDGIITKDLFIKIFKDRVGGDDLLSNYTNEELFEFIKLVFNNIKEKQLKGGIIKMKKTGGNIINIDTFYQNKKREIYNIKNPEKLLEHINKMLPFTERSKKERGEVFTPIKLVKEMIDKLPEEVWKNKNLKWLDPSAGMGNFSVAIYMKLMESLKDEFIDEDKRRRHILEEMLYMVELYKGNVYMMNNIFCGKIYKLNIFEGSFFIKGDYKDTDIYPSSIKLKNNKMFINKVKGFNNKFDIIVGNPPYQEDKASGDNKLYLDFTKNSLDILQDRGLLLFITPRNILDYLLLVEKNRNIINDFYQIKYIAIETSKHYFPKVGSTFVYFLIEKKLYYEKTIIEYMYRNKIEKMKKMLEKGFKIPKVLTKLDIYILEQLTSKTNNYKLHDFFFGKKMQRIRDSHIKKNIVTINETDKNKIKIIDTINKEKPFPGIFYYYNLKDNDFGRNKLILSKKGYLMPYVDTTKSYTYSDNFKYIIDDNMDQIKLLLESKIVDYLILQYSKNGFDRIDIIQTIHKKNLNNIKNEDELYRLYNLKEEHIRHINSILHITKKIY